MTLTQLQYLIALNRLKSFNKAAQDCHVTQPSLSAQIAKLEQELGLILFDRSRSPVVTTEAGVEIIRQAHAVLAEVSRLIELAHDTKGEISGDLKLGIIPTIAPFLLPLFLPNLSQQFPELRVEINEMPTHDLVRLVHDGEIDAAIMSTPKEAPESLLERVLFYEPFVAYLGGLSPLKPKRELHVKELPADNIVLLDEVHCLRDQVKEFCRLKEDQPFRGNTHLKSGSILTLMKLVEGSHRFTIIPSLAVRQLAHQDVKKHVRNLKAPVPVRKVSLIYHRAHVKRTKLEVLRKAILQSLPKDVPRQIAPGYRSYDPDPSRFSL